MSRHESRTGVHCVELVSGKEITGIFTADDSGTRVRLYSYTGAHHFEPEKPLYLRTADNDIASMFGNISGGLGDATRMYPEKTRVSHQELISNTCLLGAEKWNSTDKVKRVRFMLPYVIRILHNQEKINRLKSNITAASPEDYNLFQVDSEHFSVSANYLAPYSFPGNEPQNVDVVFKIEFKEPQELGAHLVAVHQIVCFFVFAIGIPISPSEVVVSRLTESESETRFMQEHIVDEHRHLDRFLAFDLNNSDASYHYSPFHANNSEEISALTSCLRVWLDRVIEWHESYVHMFECARLGREISSERLLSACRWLEAIPDAEPINAFSVSLIESITLAAIEAAKDGGHPELAERIKGLIRRLKGETHHQRFERLLDSLDLAFAAKSKVLFLKDLKRSQRLRGKAAHGVLDNKTEDKFLDCARSICAVETLCFLMSLKDLPISDQGRKLSQENRFVADYMRSS